MNRKIRFGVLLLILQISVAQLDVSYIRYFKDDRNFMSNLSMLSTDRRGLSHLAVSYNKKNQPKKKNKRNNTSKILTQ